MLVCEFPWEQVECYLEDVLNVIQTGFDIAGTIWTGRYVWGEGVI